MSWTPERIDTLTALWAEGYSASQIAAKMGGLTRNAVIGKAHRMKLGGRKPPSPLKGQAKARKAEKSAPAPKRIKPALPESPLKARLKAAREANAAARRVPVTELESRQCRYAVNEAAVGEEHLFCGAATKPGSSYCSAHHGVVYAPAPPRKRVPMSDLDALDAIRRRSVAGGRK